MNILRKKEAHPVSGMSKNGEQRSLRLCNAFYGVIAFTPSTPAIAVTTATATFKIILHTDFLIAIIPHLPSIKLKIEN